MQTLVFFMLSTQKGDSTQDQSASGCCNFCFLLCLSLRVRMLLYLVAETILFAMRVSHSLCIGAGNVTLMLAR